MDLRRWIFPGALLLVAAFLAIFRISGSSIGMYEVLLYGPGYRDANVLFGQPRLIRSDEWSVATAWTSAGASENYDTHNDVYVGGQDFSLTSVPVRSWVTIFRPQNWPFLILPVEHAFAFMWWLKAFLLGSAIYFLAMMLTNGRISIAIFATLSLIFSPYVQWWYATSVTEIIAFGVLSFVLFTRIVDNPQDTHTRLLHSILFVYCATCFSVALYPPFQIPLVIFFGFTGAGYLLSRRREGQFAKPRGFLTTMLLCLVAIGLLLSLFYISNKSSFRTVAGTAYPGDRRSIGGNNAYVLKMLAGFYNIQLQDDEHAYPTFTLNQSEASSFFFVGVLLLPFLIYFLARSWAHREAPDYLLWSWMLGVGLLLAWATIGLPAFIARIALLDFVPPNRTLAAMGLINLMLILYYLFRVNFVQTPTYRLVASVYSVAAALGVLLVGRYIASTRPVYFDNAFQLLGIAGAAGILLALLLFRQKSIFFILFLGFSFVSTYRVNPLYRGLSGQHDPKLLRKIEGLQRPDAGWVIYDTPWWADYWAANGIRVLNGTYFMPPLDLWERFDPGHQYTNIYNRYAHIVVTPSADPKKVEFKLLYGDMAQLAISPCNPLLADLGIQYHVFPSENREFACLTLLKKVEYPNTSFYLYQYSP